MIEDKPLGDLAQALTAVRQRGDLHYEELLTQMRSSVLPFVHIALLTISFLHCKNVHLQAVVPPKKPLSHKQKRRGDPSYARLTYHVLDIAPMRQVLRTQGHEERNGTKQALHICRGHFADYREGRGLFGKYQGVFWIPQHLRGSVQQGITSKDYHITL